MFQRRALYLLPLILFILHNDFWWWDDSSFFLGLPIGLSYHVLFCLAVTGVMALLVKADGATWESEPDDPSVEDER